MSIVTEPDTEADEHARAEVATTGECPAPRQQARVDAPAAKADGAGTATDPTAAASGVSPARSWSWPQPRHVAMVVGAIVMGFVVYLFLVSPLLYNRAQGALTSRLQVALSQANAGGVPRDPGRGDPIGFIDARRLGLSAVMVEGARQGQLADGPGHVRGTPLPGQLGVSIVAGRRAAFGSPFASLHSAREGDEVVLTTPRGTLNYTVVTATIVPDRPASVLAAARDGADATGSRLALVTSDPWGVAAERIVVVATLSGPPVPGGSTSDAMATEELDPDRQPGSLAALTLWSILLVAALLATSRARGAWRSPAVFLLAAPVVASLAMVLYDSAIAVLPPTL